MKARQSRTLLPMYGHSLQRFAIKNEWTAAACVSASAGEPEPGLHQNHLGAFVTVPPALRSRLQLRCVEFRVPDLYFVQHR